MTEEDISLDLLILQYNINTHFAVDNLQINKIYHYTNPESLIGILNEKKISFWFSKYDCLNDCLEGQEMIKHYRSACKELKNNGLIDKIFYDVISGLKPGKKMFCSTKDGAIKIEPIEYDSYICCFSQDNDSLDLWRYYARNNKYEGYNIGCKSKIFEELVVDIRFGDDDKKYHMDRLQKVIYDDNEKKEYYKEQIIACYKSKQSVKFICFLLSQILLYTQLIFKHKCFKSEKEIRAVMCIPKENSGYDIKYRIRNGIVVPYIEVVIDNKEYLSDITIGPLINDDIAKNNLEQYLNANGYKNVKVQKSGLPIRF
ncbi:MAG: DUF2971 domain-containing protein [Endomicrobiaceae bacterium]|nr:DUF2971 domain-containing protein [Endomicrobiaceae bacterium]